MTKLEISNQVAQKLEELSTQSHRTVDEVLLWLLDNYGHSVISEQDETEDDDTTWTEEELAQLLKPKKPLTGKQIAEKGLLGAWKDLGIEDSVKWVEQQRAKRKDKFKW